MRMRTGRWAAGLLLAIIQVTVIPAVFSADESKREGQAEEKAESFPIQLDFEAPDPPKLNQPVSVTLVVKGDPEGWQPAMSGEGRIELLLRLPVGVKLEGEEWKPIETPAAEKDDPSGPWTLYGLQQPVSVPQSVSKGQVLARIPVKLTIVQEGQNWVVTSRLRLVQGEQAFQTFGVIFATIQEGVAEFSATPRVGYPEEEEALAFPSGKKVEGGRKSKKGDAKAN